MILKIKANPKDWNKKLWIASKIETITDDEGNLIDVYSEPIPYEFNYQPLTSDSDLREFGEKANMTQKAIIPIEYKDVFKEFDVAYLDGATPENETNNGDKANYRLHPPRNQNSVIAIYFEKLTGK